MGRSVALEPGRAAVKHSVDECTGRVEVIPIQFRKDPSATKWNFHGLGFTPKDYALTGTVQVRPELLEHGYEMRKANVEVCKAW